ncbi:hypothetical protein D4S03_10190 [bacterium]|nr:MAG: hypothetical protein D4S03_10190 [bacterium]
MTNPTLTYWALLWRQTRLALDGPHETLMYRDGAIALFNTRREARAYAHEGWGYIATRPDLRAAPHGWTVPQPVRVEIRRK